MNAPFLLLGPVQMRLFSSLKSVWHSILCFFLNGVACRCLPLLVVAWRNLFCRGKTETVVVAWPVGKPVLSLVDGKLFFSLLDGFCVFFIVGGWRMFFSLSVADVDVDGWFFVCLSVQQKTHTHTKENTSHLFFSLLAFYLFSIELSRMFVLMSPGHKTWTRIASAYFLSAAALADCVSKTFCCSSFASDSLTAMTAFFVIP